MASHAEIMKLTQAFEVGTEQTLKDIPRIEQTILNYEMEIERLSAQIDQLKDRVEEAKEKLSEEDIGRGTSYGIITKLNVKIAKLRLCAENANSVYKDAVLADIAAKELYVLAEMQNVKMERIETVVDLLEDILDKQQEVQSIRRDINQKRADINAIYGDNLADFEVLVDRLRDLLEE